MAFENDQDNKDLRRAVEILEFPTFTSKAAKYIGRPLEMAVNALPESVVNKVAKYTQEGLKHAFRVVMLTVNQEKRFKKAHNIIHKGLVVASGAVGGFFGGAAMAVELPVSTAIMMRSIAEIAREEGEDLAEVEPRLACISVLGLDTSVRKGTEEINSSRYFHVRNILAAEVKKAAEYLVTNSLADEGAPIIVQLLKKIAERFGIQLTEKMAAEMVPVIGAVGGGSINFLFIDHFQRIARGHFIVRRLERKYGSERVEREYEAVLAEIMKKRRTKSVETFYDIDEVAATSEEK